jgi:hypothetical protein
MPGGGRNCTHVHPCAYLTLVLRIAIIGLGPWGLCALERLITSARRGLPAGLQIEIHTIDPGPPGSGVYALAQPDYLLLNNPCAQLSLYPFEDEGEGPRYGVGLYEWAVENNYRWVGEQCLRDASGAPIEPHHFLPRRLMGEYLNWFWQTLIEEAPASVSVLHYATSAVDVIQRHDETELVHLASGESLPVDQVILTSGHTANQDPHDVVPHLRQLSAYPVDRYVDQLPPGLDVGVAGMGLVAIDVVTALTIGRGGTYSEQQGRLHYRPSRREPVIHLYSRSGLPFTAKPVTGVDRTDVYRPIIGTPEAFESLTTNAGQIRRQVDVRKELLALMFAEMYARYYAQAAFQAAGRAEGASVRDRLSVAWQRREYDRELESLAGRYGSFDAEELFFGAELADSSSEDYERAVYDMLERDLREAEVPAGNSPVKLAAEVFRVFRDPMRSVVEQGGLSLDSYLDFNADIRSRITRLVAGPPALRTRQFMALMEAGLLRVPFGAAPAIGPGEGVGALGHGPARVSSTMLEHPFRRDLALVIRGHLEEPHVDGSASQLLRRLYGRGRISQFRYGAVTVGSVDLTPDSHPIDATGDPQKRIWMFGVLTEGIRHFTHYLPSPKSRIRAFEEIGRCVAEILQSAP